VPVTVIWIPARRLIVQATASETQAQVSPDGRWLAYISNETGRDEVYLQSFPQPGTKRQVTTEGGVMPRWRKDMNELFFVDIRGGLNAVTVRRAVDPVWTADHTVSRISRSGLGGGRLACTVLAERRRPTVPDQRPPR
jgi:WD40-like Beta Propeller Repeat